MQPTVSLRMPLPVSVSVSTSDSSVAAAAVRSNSGTTPASQSHSHTQEPGTGSSSMQIESAMSLSVFTPGPAATPSAAAAQPMLVESDALNGSSSAQNKQQDSEDADSFGSSPLQSLSRPRALSKLNSMSDARLSEPMAQSHSATPEPLLVGSTATTAAAPSHCHDHNDDEDFETMSPKADDDEEDDDDDDDDDEDLIHILHLCTCCSEPIDNQQLSTCSNCRRAFHPDCANKDFDTVTATTSIAPQDDPKLNAETKALQRSFSRVGCRFVCAQCAANKLSCSICHQTGPLVSTKPYLASLAKNRPVPQVEADGSTPVVQCLKPGCVSIVHLHCAKKDNLGVVRVGSTGTCVCPQHFCNTCEWSVSRKKISSRKGAAYTQCVACPAVFHRSSCLPPGSYALSRRFVLCADHPISTITNPMWHRAHVPRVGTVRHVKTLCDSDSEMDSDDEDNAVSRLVDGLHPDIAQAMAFRRLVQSNRPPENVHLFSLPVAEPKDPKEATSASNSGCAIDTTMHTSPTDADTNKVTVKADTDNTLAPDSSAPDTVVGPLVVQYRDTFCIHPFRLPKWFKIQAEAYQPKRVPPPYKKIFSNVYKVPKAPKPRRDEIEVCMCNPNTGNCGNNCMNRVTLMECDRKQCPCGERCTNQRIQRRQYVKAKVTYQAERGFGLSLKEDAKAGDLVVEYCGEVIDSREARRRLEDADSDVQHYYLFQVNNSMVIDAAHMGNNARFINHSCDPNCIAEKWLVSGQIRVGIFTKTTLPAGTELTYNYNFEGLRNGLQTQRCLCGSANCSGFLGVRPKAPTKNVKSNSKSKKSKGTKRSKARAKVKSKAKPTTAANKKSGLGSATLEPEPASGAVLAVAPAATPTPTPATPIAIPEPSAQMPQ
jgi:SET domain/AWS domain/Histone-lysine N-methyltransferase NSD-like, variant PHD zinc finger